MKVHTEAYKNQIKTLGREIDSKITYTIDNEEIELGVEDLNSITPMFKGALLKSVMKELEIDSNEEIPLGTVLNYQFGVKVNGAYEYLDFGNYIVNKAEKKEDTYSWKINCYDKMLYSMVSYEPITISEPITIREYITRLCRAINLDFANEEEEFCNYDKLVEQDLFADQGLTYRDVLDQIAEVTGSMVCINDDDELELRYITEVEPTPEGKNKLRKSLGFVNGYISSTNVFTPDNKTALFNQYIQVEAGETYCLSVNANVNNMVVSMFASDDTFLGRQKVTNANKIVQEMGNNVSYVRFAINYNNSATMTQEIIDNLEPMIELGNDRTTPYEDYIPPVYGDTVNEEFLKDVDVNFGEKFGPINTIVLARAADSDRIYKSYPDDLPEEDRIEIKISENQFMNFNDRDQYLPDLLDTLKGIEFYTNDYTSTGITYYDLGDYYTVQIGETSYKCLMLNDTIEISKGLSESIYTEHPEKSETDYKKSDKTDNRINKAYIIVDKQNQQIEALTSQVTTIENQVGDSYTKEEINQLIQTANEGVTNNFINSGGNNLLRNTGLWFEDRSEIEYMYPHSSLYPDDNLFMSADPHWEYWKGNAKKIKEDKASNLSGILLQTGYLEQTQQVRNGTYTLSFKYRKLIELATVNVQINDRYLDLTNIEDTEIIEVGEITAQNISIKIFSDTDDSCVIYDLMLNAGSEKAEYSQHQNETTTDTVNISKGITIQSSDTNTTFKANSDGIRVYNSRDMDTPITEYTDTGMDTNRIKVKEEAEIIQVLWKNVGNNTWISRL